MPESVVGNVMRPEARSRELDGKLQPEQISQMDRPEGDHMPGRSE